ncbi:gamma-aminobutyric acid type B receptor subunit 2-like [Mya arenaria]|uniref:gamma-aminobutyric acid type B receptor subunit 2-like n=1 Tax=Mya arenaria TaxID=6604 RepID=UPI0022E29B78|nr:gamma-aminobutyric acid type B receptor subunit 2-like [Mya arenaria]
MSSPYVNYVIIIGCMVMYSEVYLGTMEYMHVGNRSRSEDFMCMSRSISITIGFTLLFGSMFAKTYRVHYLFREHKIRKKFIKDRHLLAMVFVLILIDLAILVPWSTLFPFRQQQIVKLTKDSADKNLIYSEIFPYCYNEKQMYWLVTLYVYKGLLLAFGTFLAWETRHVTIPELNDSKYIGACIYNVVVVCVFGVPLAHVLPIEQTTLNFVLESFLLIFCTTICACIIFVPKIKARNKVQGRMLQSDMTKSACSGTSGSRVNSVKTVSGQSSGQIYEVSSKTSTEDMTMEIKELKNQITMDAIAMAKLKKSILAATGNLHFYKSGNEYVVFQSGSSMKGDYTDPVSDLNLQSVC